MIRRQLFLLHLAAALVLCCSLASAQQIATLRNTGVDSAGVPLADDMPDPHWTLVAPSPQTGAPLVATSANEFPIPPWILDNDQSAWITTLNTDASGPGSNADAGVFADYHYRTTFSLSGFDPSTAVIEGRAAYDNFLQDVLVNGASTGISFPADNPGGSFGEFTDFAFDANAIGLLNPGDNTVEFVVRGAQADGADDFTGLRVEWTTATAVPEPVTLVMLSMGVMMLCLGRRKSRR